MINEKPIYVTQPSLPDLQEFIPYLQQIWENKILTNSGPFHQELEIDLASFLNVPYVSLFANGTLALVTALQVLRISGEVITTPYSFVATSHSLLWNNLKPVFVDIEPKFCINQPSPCLRYWPMSNENSLVSGKYSLKLPNNSLNIIEKVFSPPLFANER